MPLTLIHLQSDRPEEGKRLDALLSEALRGFDVRKERELPDRGTLAALRTEASPEPLRLLFAVPLGEAGLNAESVKLLRRLRTEPDLLCGCVSALIVDGGSEYYTKAAATELAFALNGAGSALIGRPLVEGTGSLVNFRVQAKKGGTDVRTAYTLAARDLAERLLAHSFPTKERPRLLALHASSYKTSNTMQLWGEVKRRLGDACDIEEIGLRNGTINDCAGCPYTACRHFGEQGRCFYGGLIQEEVWPAVLRADALVLLCPNYNDAISANITAFINRLTGLFRQKRFYDKAFFAIIVSGYSGSDIVARQLIGAMNMNKSFYLPPRFALIETANDPGEALSLPGIAGRISSFADRIRDAFRIESFCPAERPFRTDKPLPDPSSIHPIRQCALERNLETCGNCGETDGCEKPGMIVKNNLDALRNLKEYAFITLRNRPELMDRAAVWFHEKWGVPTEAYLECMTAYLNRETEYGWYLCMDGDRIAGGLGVIENDFHDRKDLTPNVCAVYTEEAYRLQGIAGRLLNMVVEDMRAKGITPLYLVTDHTGFYERYGWEFLCMVQGDGEPEMTRMYMHQ